MKQKWIIAIPIFFLIVASVFTIMIATGKEEKAETETSIKTFAEYTDREEFQNVPLLDVKNAHYGDAVDCGRNNYVLDVNGTTLKDYQSAF